MTNYQLSGVLRGCDRDTVWVVDGRLSDRQPAGPVEQIRGYCYPGLLDCHTHPGLRRVPQPLSVEQIRQRLSILARAGITAVRDAGGQQNPNIAHRTGLPKVIHCGQHIAQYKRYPRYLAAEIEPKDLVGEALRQLAVSDGWIKIVGDWIDRSLGADADLTPLWPREVLVDAVQAVHEAGGKVTVHSFARETVDDLLLAGVDGIEHGTGMTRDQLVEARDQGILITPTVHQIRRFPEFARDGAKFPRYVRRMLAMDAEREEHLAMMVDVGIRMLMGSDTAENVAEVNLIDELIDAVDDGIPADRVMAAASYSGRQYLGLPNWQVGAPADVVVFADDPEQDIAVVRQPRLVLIDGCVPR
ncbi:amidohydrolase family protein [Trueperella sp. LYQ143]|uniref:amidohydrolase family protein n=1 Tax=Trueperella sp. LYQ143 TaxID=3391059 RepID=UPI0039836189